MASRECRDYLGLLASEVEAVRSDIQEDIDEATRGRAARRLDPLHIVDYKLKHLAQQVDASRRILNDLRMLRRLLVADGDAAATGLQQPDETGPARP